MSLMPWSSHSATTGSGTSSRTPIPGCFAISHDTTPSSARPTFSVFVNTTGTSRNPDWSTQWAPVISPLPLSTNVAAATRWFHTSSLARIPVAPVRTFVPSTLDTCATRTPATSVIPSTAPGDNVPIGTGVRAAAGTVAHASTMRSASERRIEPVLGAMDDRPRERAGLPPQRLVRCGQGGQPIEFDAPAGVWAARDRLGEQPFRQRVVARRPAQASVDRALALPGAMRRGAQRRGVQRDAADRAPQRCRFHLEILEAVAHEFAEDEAVPGDRAVLGLDRVARALRVVAVVRRIAQVAVVGSGAVVASAARAGRQPGRVRRERARLVARQLQALAVHCKALRAAADPVRGGAHAVREAVPEPAARGG